MGNTEVVLIVLVLLAVFTAAKGIRTVPQGQVWTVERFGRFTTLLQPGLNFIVPFMDQVGRRLNVQEVVLDIPEQSVITKDNASVAVDGIVYYRVMDPAKAAYAVQNLQQALTSLAMTNIRAVIGEMDLDATLSGREQINSSLLRILDGATEPWGVKVSRIELRKVEPPENLVRAMNLQMTAERERRASVMRAEGEKQALVLQAEGRQQSAMRDAEARERLAEAEAKATRLVADAASGAGEAALRYFISDKYVRAFEALAGNPNSKLVIVPMEATALFGGISAALQMLQPPGAPGIAAAAPRQPMPPPQPGPAAPTGGSPSSEGGSPSSKGGSPWTQG